MGTITTAEALMSTTIQKLAARVDKSAEAALKTYRAAVESAAAGDDLTDKEIAKVADVIAGMMLTPADFADDVAAYKNYLIAKARIEEMPTQAERDARERKLSERVLQIEQEIRDKLKEKGQVHAEVSRNCHNAVQAQRALETIKRANPRLFSMSHPSLAAGETPARRQSMAVPSDLWAV